MAQPTARNRSALLARMRTSAPTALRGTSLTRADLAHLAHIDRAGAMPSSKFVRKAVLQEGYSIGRIDAPLRGDGGCTVVSIDHQPNSRQRLAWKGVGMQMGTPNTGGKRLASSGPGPVQAGKRVTRKAAK